MEDEVIRTTNQRRLLQITAGNVRNSHIYVSKHYDFFPADCIGASHRSKGESRPIEIVLDGLDRTVKTDIGSSATTGKPRGFFRGRTWVRQFFEHHKVVPGEQLSLERVEPRRYRLSVVKKKPRAAEFFSGIGLVRLALERQGWEVVFANDIDPDKEKIYRDNWSENDHLVTCDIRDIQVNQIPDCDLVTASFPCNDLSIAGKWEGLNGKESSAFWILRDKVRALRDAGRQPRLILLENVVGFLMSHGGKDFEQALVALNELGYAVDAFILNAVHWVPQSRARLFVIGKLDATPRQPFAVECQARPEALTRFIYQHDNIRWDVEKLPALPKPSSNLVEVLEDLADSDPHWWNKERAEYFLNQLSERHSAIANEMIEGRKYTYATAFRRVRNGRSMAELRSDGIAGCLRTPRGGSGRQILFKAGRGRYQVRLLTARECARLQGVPDSYAINVPLNQALFGFGDAVCVPAVEWIISNYLNQILR
jgi:DNA (cytosine-5)-methyltransferase 1